MCIRDRIGVAFAGDVPAVADVARVWNGECGGETRNAAAGGNQEKQERQLPFPGFTRAVFLPRGYGAVGGMTGWLRLHAQYQTPHRQRPTMTVLVSSNH